MSLLKSILLGREDGIRASIRRRIFGGAAKGAGSKGTAAVAPDHQPRPAEAALGLKPEAPKDVTPPQGYEVVLHKDALKAGKVTEIIIAGKAIAVANVGGTFHACTNACPHADGPLGEGTLEGSTLTCPYHGWQFDLHDGTCSTNAAVKLPLYDVQVVGDAVCVKI